MNFNKYSIKRSSVDIETHEVFLDDLAHQKEAELGISEKKFEVRIKEKFIYAIFVLFFLATFLLFTATFYLQVIQGDDLYTLAENNKGKIALIRPERGIVYDRNFTKLVSNVPSYDFTCNKAKLSESTASSQKEIKQISEILKKEFSEIEKIIKDAEAKNVLVAENLDQETILIISSRLNDLPSCQIEKNTVRNYVFGNIFSHVLGYNGRINKEELKSVVNYSFNDYIGKSGLEKFYETYLRGDPGKVVSEQNANGNKKGDTIISSPKDGDTLVLNIDANLQKKVYESLEKSIKNIGAHKGAAIALDPRNGSVLAIVSYPSYDDNIFTNGISREDLASIQKNPYQPLFNRAVLAQYPIGSTIKPFLASAALQEKLISPTKLINDPGYITVKNQYNPNIVYTFSGIKPHGLVDMKKAIAVSSNVYFYTVGGGYKDQQGLGPGRIKKYLDIYGFEQETGIDLPAEFSGFVPTPTWKKEVKKEPWWDGDTYNLSIGQSDLQVTPLQVAVAYSAIANGGKLYRPHIVQKIINSSGGDQQVVEEFQPELIGNISIDPANLEIVREGMRESVQKDYGSSFTLNDLPVAVAGKTGTVETRRQGFYNTWSSSFAPYNNPEIVFVATIEDVQGLQSATLPVAHDVLQYYFSGKK